MWTFKTRTPEANWSVYLAFSMEPQDRILIKECSTYSEAQEKEDAFANKIQRFKAQVEKNMRGKLLELITSTINAEEGEDIE